MRFDSSIAMASLLLAGLALAKAQQNPDQWQTPPQGTDLAPASVAPATRTPTETPKRPAPAQPAHKSKPKKQSGTRFSGTLSAVDRSAMTITIESGGKSRVYGVTSRTRLFKDGKPAILADGVIGEHVTGLARTTKNGKAELISVTFSARSSGTSGTRTSKK